MAKGILILYRILWILCQKPAEIVFCGTSLFDYVVKSGIICYCFCCRFYFFESLMKI